MSDTENPGPDENLPAPDAADQPGTGEGPAVPPDTEPTTPYPAQPAFDHPAFVPPSFEQPPAPPAPEQPTAAYPTAPPPYPSPYGEPTAPIPAYLPPPAGFAFPPATPVQPVAGSDRPRIPGKLWPLVTVLALVVGAIAGAVGGALVADGKNDDSSSTGGILKIERRGEAPLAADNGSIAAVAKKVLPSTVQIVAEYKGEALGATGSGFVLDDKGHVITNNHVIADAAKDNGPIDVIDQDNQHHKATIVGRSPAYDIAVLEVTGINSLPPVALGSATQMRVGETVTAFGSPLAYTSSVTSGIISAKNRPVAPGGDGDTAFINAIQTDAAINPGNSGGPLANLQGQVIGMNSAIASLGSSSSDEGSNIGIGFAIPVEQIEITVDQILRTGKAQYPVVGVGVQGTNGFNGAKVTKIDADSPAASTGLKVGDVIVAVDDRPVNDQTDVVVAIRSYQVSDTVTLTVHRGSQTLKIKTRLKAKTG
ncbi:MAG: S1C family serine protease [Marmoricola sp.]